MAIDWIGFGYAALVVSGGVVGFIKAGKLGRPRFHLLRSMQESKQLACCTSIDTMGILQHR